MMTRDPGPRAAREEAFRFLHVPYPGSPPERVDLVAGTVKVGLDTVTVTAPHVKAGRLGAGRAGRAIDARPTGRAQAGAPKGSACTMRVRDIPAPRGIAGDRVDIVAIDRCPPRLSRPRSAPP